MINLNHCLITKIFILCDIRVYVYIYFGFSKYTSHKTNTALSPMFCLQCAITEVYVVYTRLHMTFTSENYSGVNLLTYLPWVQNVPLFMTTNKYKPLFKIISLFNSEINCRQNWN